MSVLAEHDRTPAFRPHPAMVDRLRKAVGDPAEMEHVLRVAAQVQRAKAAAAARAREPRL